MERLLFPEDPPYIHGSATSRAAAEAIEPQTARLRRAVLEALRAAPDGLTDEEGVDASGIAANTWRPRRLECVALGLVVDSGTTRKTRSGRNAVVWRA